METDRTLQKNLFGTLLTPEEYELYRIRMRLKNHIQRFREIHIIIERRKFREPPNHILLTEKQTHIGAQEERERRIEEFEESQNFRISAGGDTPTITTINNQMVDLSGELYKEEEIGESKRSKEEKLLLFLSTYKGSSIEGIEDFDKYQLNKNFQEDKEIQDLYSKRRKRLWELAQIHDILLIKIIVRCTRNRFISRYLPYCVKCLHYNISYLEYSKKNCDFKYKTMRDNKTYRKQLILLLKWYWTTFFSEKEVKCVNPHCKNPIHPDYISSVIFKNLKNIRTYGELLENSIEPIFLCCSCVDNPKRIDKIDTIRK